MTADVRKASKASNMSKNSSGHVDGHLPLFACCPPRCPLKFLDTLDILATL